LDSVELVKKICKERKIPISALEKGCGFSNGYIRKLKEGKFPTNRIQKIADFLDVSVDYLMTGKEDNEFSPANAEIDRLVRSNPELKNLVNDYLKLSDDNKKMIINLINALNEANK